VIEGLSEFVKSLVVLSWLTVPALPVSGRRAQPGGSSGSFPGASPVAYLYAWVLRWGFTGNAFQVIAHPPERWVGLTKLRWLIPHHGGECGSMRVLSCFITGRLPPVRKAVRQFERVNVAHR
jgi:hypothetical protein